ncbi:MAG: hypothetical protein NDI66_04180 [Pseudomonas sp.]|nr:hypothetical protein [Pseudomonas sp.]
MPSWLMDAAPTLAVGLLLGIGLAACLRLADRREAQHRLERRRRQFGTPLSR